MSRSKRDLEKSLAAYVSGDDVEIKNRKWFLYLVATRILDDINVQYDAKWGLQQGNIS